MTEQHVDIESIFDRAVEIDSPEQQRTYLDEACGSDRELRARVEALLRANNDAGNFLEKPPAGLVATIATGESDRVDGEVGEVSLDFLAPSEKANCLGTLGQYEVVEVAGRGGMGVVLRAYDTKLNRVVAIKAMAPELAANPMAAKRFLREARAAAAISYDHVVTIHAIEEDNRPPYLVMEFVNGQSLQEKIDRCGALDVKAILRIAMQVARGLAAAHEQGLVHRDIKPANILLENGVERVKLTDFGLARAVDDASVTQTGQIAGTPQFMSPEQAQGEAVDARTDLFSLGSVMYTMCTGRPPFRADSAVATLRRVCDDAVRPIQEVNSEIPDWLVEIIDRLLAKNRDDRIPTAGDVAELLNEHLAHLQHSTITPAHAPLPAIPKSAGVAVTKHSEVSIRRIVRGPSVGLVATACLNWILLTSLIIGSFVLNWRMPQLALLFVGGGALIFASLQIYGALRMRDLKGYGWAIAASVLAMLITPGNLIGLPIGIWALYVLTLPAVREVFQLGVNAAPASMFSRLAVRVVLFAAVMLVAIGCTEMAAMTHVSASIWRMLGITGTLVVNVPNPDMSVTVQGNGRSIMSNSNQRLELEPGIYRVYVSYSSNEYQLRHMEVAGVERNKESVVNIKLDDKWEKRLAGLPERMAATDATRAATLVVEVEIPNVHLTINGEYLKLPAAGPHELVLKPGWYVLAVRKANQQIAVQRVTLERGQRRTIRFRPSDPLLSTDTTLLDKQSVDRGQGD
jgi:serine/threonine protein kinase